MEPVWADAPRLAPRVPRPSYRFRPGLDPHPRRHPLGSLRGDPPWPAGLPPDRWRDDVSWLAGIDLYHEGYLWEAHEAWEACFFAARDRAHAAGDAALRDAAMRHVRLAQALIQLAAAVLQSRMGVPGGVRILAGKVRAKLQDVSPSGVLAGVDVPSLLRDVERHFAAAFAGGDPCAVSGEPPRIRVTP